jgi:hypothetical protein
LSHTYRSSEAHSAEVVEPRPEEAALGVRLGDDVHLSAQRLHQVLLVEGLGEETIGTTASSTGAAR